MTLTNADEHGAARRSSRLGSALIAITFAAMSLLMRAAVKVCFRRLHVNHRERFPPRGSVLLVANHPAMWTDVLVLDVALGRKLHFLVKGSLFRPLARAFILELHGALPVLSSLENCEARSRNEATFLRCRELFARGEVVALFPEGVSVADRTVLQLKTGAARIALEQADAGPEGGGPVVLPAGIHYASRTSFGSDVTVSLGEPIALEPYRVLRRSDPEAAVHALTDHMRHSLRALILDLPEPALAAAVAELEPLAGLSPRRGTRELDSAQRIANRLKQIRASAPVRFQAICRRSRAYRRARRALGLSDLALLWEARGAPWRQRLSLLVTLCALGAVPASVGAAVHAVPWAAGEWIAHKVGVDPARFTFGRISSGLVLFPVTYSMLLLALRSLLHLSALQLLAVPVAFVALGLFTLTYSRWAHALWERLRLILLERRHPRLVRRARAEQRALLSLLTEAEADGTAGTRASA